MAPNSAASRLAKMMRSYRNGGYVYAQGSDEVPTGSSAPQGMTREEYLAFPQNFMELFGIEEFLKEGRPMSAQERRQYVAENEALPPEGNVPYTAQERLAYKKALDIENLKDFWNQVTALEGGQKVKLPMTGAEWTRPKNVDYIARQDESGNYGFFGSEYDLPRQGIGDTYYKYDQPKGGIYFSMMSPRSKEEYLDLQALGKTPEEVLEREEGQAALERRFGSDFQRMVEQKMIEEAIRARSRAKQAGVYQ